MPGPMLRQLDPTLYKIARGQLAMRLFDLQTGEVLAQLQNFGDITCDFDYSSQETEIRSSEDPSRRIVASDTVQADGKGKGKFRQFGRIQNALGYQAQPAEFLAQSASSGSCTFNDIVPGQILEIKDVNGTPVYNLASATVADPKWTTDAGNVKGAYKAFLGLGRVEIRFLPAGVTSITVAWTSDSGAEIAQYRPMSQTNFGAYIEIYENNVRGKNLFYTFPYNKIKITKSPTMISDANEPAEAEFEATLMSDFTAAPGFEYGQILEYDINKQPTA